MNPTPFKKVLQSLHSRFPNTHFLVAFLKTSKRFQRFYFVWSLVPYLQPEVDTLSFPLKIVLNDGILKVELFLRLQ